MIAVSFLFIYPQSCIEAAKDGVTTALYIVLPSIFPFMVLSKFIIARNLHYLASKIIGKPFEFLFGVNRKYAVVFVLGCIGGYPIGAIAINELLKKDEITVKDAEFLLGFCNNSGPMFIIGTVGTLMLNNTSYGYILYIIHILSVILGGIIMRIILRPSIKTCALNTYKNNLSVSNSVTSSASAMINIASYIIIFSVIAKFVTVFLDAKSFRALLVLSALGFSGLCVFSQSKAVFENVKFSFSKYIFSKLIIAIISFVTTAITFTIIFSY